MPTLIPEERKAKIVKRYKELFNEINTFIESEDNKLSEDVMFEGGLDTPSTLECYNIAKEMEEMKVQQNRILDDLAKNNPLHISDDRKWLVCAIKSEDTPAARAYNEKLYRDYQENPDKVKAILFRKVMTFDPHKLTACNDKNDKLLQFYKENHEVVDLADVLANSNGAPFYEGQNPQFVNALDQMIEPLNVLAYPKHLAEQATGDDFYAMPYLLNHEAKEILINADKANKDFKGYVRDHLESLAGNDLTCKPKAYFKAINDANPRLSTDDKLISTYLALNLNHGHEPALADFTDVLKDPKNNAFFRRQENESFAIRAINSEYAKVYQKNWVKYLNIKNKLPEGTTVKETLDKNKGGFFEKLFNTTSNEYKEFEQAFEDYNNPDSQYYLNDKHLRMKSDAYLEHKGVDEFSDIDFSKMDATSRGRVKLVINTIQNLNQSDNLEKTAEKDLELGYPAIGKTFLSEKDVGDSFDKENNNIEQEIENENIIENDEIKM